MKVAAAAVAIPLLLVLVLLTWFSVRALDTDAEIYDQGLAALDQFTTVENALNRDVLSARAGLLRNYDPLVQQEKALRGLLERLRETVATNAKGAAIVDRLAVWVDRQEVLVEQFKSNNALLQNSLAYLGRFSGQISSSNEDALLSPAVRALVSATLHLTLDTSAEATRDLENRLRELNAQLDKPERIQVLLAHVQLLCDLLPATDNLLKTLLAAPGADEQTAMRSLVLARQHASRETARRYRLLLYTTSLFLLGILVHLGLRLRRRTLALRHRAEFEHVITSISMRFIDAQSHEIAARVEEALAQIAALVGAERAYFLLPHAPTRGHTWCRDGTAFPPGWPDRVGALASRFNQNDGVILVPRVRRLPRGAERDALAAIGLESWICITAVGEAAPSILGFDILRRGSIHTSCEISLLRMARDAVANAVGRDLLDQERRRLKTRLEQARRLETVGALASGIAHNFNNLVGAILGYAEMAEAELAARRPPVHNLGEIRRVGERASALVDQIMAFGRHRDATRRPLSVHRLVAESVSLLRALLPPACSLAIDEMADRAVVSGSAAQLQQVIVNLCTNAARAMSNAGCIELATRVCEIARPRQLTHGELEAGHYVCIAVTDIGHGMDEATVSRIFAPFFTTRDDGNGLGLATVREIVRDHGGAIDVRSQLGVGSQFTVWLPCSAAAMDVAAEADRSSLPLGAGETLMVVDTDREQLLRHEEVLAALGYEPVGFTDAAAALAACRASPVRFDAMLVCRLTPPTAVLELVATIRGIAPSLPILRAMASLDSVCADALLAAGLSEIVHVPLISGEIAEALARSLAMTRARPMLRA